VNNPAVFIHYIMEKFIIVLCLICIVFLLFCIWSVKQSLKVALSYQAEKVADATAAKQALKEVEDKITLQKQTLKDIEDSIVKTKEDYLNKKVELEKKFSAERTALMSNFQSEINIYKENSHEAANAYIDTLEEEYTKAEQKFHNDLEAIKREKQKNQDELNTLKATRQAAYEAYLKEKQINAARKDYCLIPTDSELLDIKKLNRLKEELNKPRILSMLIWQTYYQPLAKKQFPILIGGADRTGIYKITNQETGECYIGQAKLLNKRWQEHCKCGLGIDTPPGNKLYKAMLEYGLENFSFEVLEFCTAAELNEKEHYYIDLYNADMFYNSNKGINK